MLKQTFLVLIIIISVLLFSACSKNITETPKVINTPTDTPKVINTTTDTAIDENENRIAVNRFVDKTTNIHFSYNPPENWERTIMVDPMYGYRYLDDTTLSFQFLGNNYPSAKEGSDAWIELMLKGSEYETISSENFKTNSNTDAYKIVDKVKFTNREDYLLFTFYYFQENGTLIQASFDRKWDFHQDLDEMIDQSMSTFQFEDNTTTKPPQWFHP